MAAEQAEFLLAMGGILGRIQVDGDAAHAPAPQSAALGGDDGIGHAAQHAAQRRATDRVLEPRQRGLRAQGRASQRVAVQGQLVQRIVGQPRGVVAIGVAQRQPEHALPHQVQDGVLDLPRLSPIAQAARQRRGHPEPGIQRLEQEQPPVGAGVRLVEGHGHRLEEGLVLEGQLRYTDCSHRASSRVCDEASRHRSYRTLQRLGGSSVSSFVNNPG